MIVELVHQVDALSEGIERDEMLYDEDRARLLSICTDLAHRLLEAAFEEKNDDRREDACAAFERVRRRSLPRSSTRFNS